MARDYATTKKCVGTTGFTALGIPVATPYSYYCAFRAPNVTAEGYPAGAAQISGGAANQMIGTRGDIGGDPVLGYFVGGAADNVLSSNAYSASVWMHATVVLSSSTAAAIILGTTKTTKTVNSSSTGAGANHVPILGAYANGNSTYSSYFQGQVSRFAWWSAALTDDEVAAIHKGFSPRRIRPSELQIYIPNVREAFDWRRSNALTDDGVAYDHPGSYGP